MKNKLLVAGLVVVACFTQLTACGLSGMAASTATEAATQAEAAKNAKALEDKVKHDVEAAQQNAKEQVDRAEAEAAEAK